MSTSSPLCQLNGGCMGCCGHDFGTKEQIKEAIQENTTEFQKAKPQTEQQFMTFRYRAHPFDLRYGVCRNLIEEKGCHLCPLHPTRHQGKDLRINHCDVNYLCKTATLFAGWSKQQQEAFINFIELKNIDNLTYSIAMDSNQLLNEFIEKEEKICKIVL